MARYDDQTQPKCRPKLTLKAKRALRDRWNLLKD